MNKRTALIVGAGIGGLAAALALRRAGWEVRVFERAATPRELGFALALAPNAMAALASLGLADAVAAEGVVTRVMEFRRTDGRVRRRIDLDAIGLTERFGFATIVALRPALHGALLEAVGRAPLELGNEAVGVSARDGSVVLELAGGRTVSGEVLIGADGIGSAIRRQLHPNEPPPRPSGFSAIRGVAHDVGHHLGDANAVWYVGDGIEIGVARASRSAVYWYVSLLTSDVAHSARDPRELVDRLTTGLDPMLHTVTAATSPEDLRFDELLVRDPLTTWGGGAVTLLGDAAHPMLPHAGQGAAQAIEDAVVLGQLLDGTRDVKSALRLYEHSRMKRTHRFVRMAGRIARISTPHNPLIRGLRDFTLSILPARFVVPSAPEAVLTAPATRRRSG